MLKLGGFAAEHFGQTGFSDVFCDIAHFQVWIVARRWRFPRSFCIVGGAARRLVTYQCCTALSWCQRGVLVVRSCSYLDVPSRL